MSEKTVSLSPTSPSLANSSIPNTEPILHLPSTQS